MFSGSAGIGPRNATVEAAVSKELNARLRSAFDSDSGFSLVEVKSFQIMQVIHDKMDWAPLQMQVFYQRYPEGEETENVPSYESKIPNYLFEQDQGSVVNSSGTHFMIELDESTEKKAKAYYTTKNIYLIVLSITVIGLSALFIVRQIKKHRKYKQK